MSSIPKQIKRNDNRLVDLGGHSDEELHCLMDSVTAEMAKRASVKAARREVMRKLENLAVSEGVTLEEMREFMRVNGKRQGFSQPTFQFEGESSADVEAAVAPSAPGAQLPETEQDVQKKPSLDPLLSIVRDESLESRFEKMLEQELSELS